MAVIMYIEVLKCSSPVFSPGLEDRALRALHDNRETDDSTWTCLKTEMQLSWFLTRSGGLRT